MNASGRPGADLIMHACMAGWCHKTARARGAQRRICAAGNGPESAVAEPTIAHRVDTMAGPAATGGLRDAVACRTMPLA